MSEWYSKQKRKADQIYLTIEFKVLRKYMQQLKTGTLFASYIATRSLLLFSTRGLPIRKYAIFYGIKEIKQPQKERSIIMRHLISICVIKTILCFYIFLEPP